MKSKKISILILFALIAVGAFHSASCGGDDGNNKQTKESNKESNNKGNQSLLPRTIEDQYPDGEKKDAFSGVFFLNPVPSSCKLPSQEKGKQTFPFILTAKPTGSTIGAPLNPGDFVGHMKYVPNGRINADLFGAAYVALQPAYSSLLPMNVANNGTCPSTCGQGLACLRAGVGPKGFLQCGRHSSIFFQPGSVKFLSKQGKNVTAQVAFLQDSSRAMYKVYSLKGNNVETIYEKFKNSLQYDFEQLNKSRNYHFNYASFGSNFGVELNLLSCTSDKDKVCFVDTGTFIKNLNKNLTKVNPPKINVFNNIYSSIIKVAENFELENKRIKRTNKDAIPDKYLFVFTAGPNNVSYPKNNINVDDVIKTLKKEKIRTFIIHIDPDIGDTWNNTWPDYDNKAKFFKTCTQDTDCKNYEECRLLVQSKDVTPTYVANASTKYCRPKFDPISHRIGPIDEYSRIACETGGSYFYYPDLRAAYSFFVNFSSIVTSLYSIDASLSGVQELDKSEYLLSGELYLDRQSSNKTQVLHSLNHDTHVGNRMFIKLK